MPIRHVIHLKPAAPGGFDFLLFLVQKSTKNRFNRVTLVFCYDAGRIIKNMSRDNMDCSTVLEQHANNGNNFRPIYR